MSDLVYADNPPQKVGLLKTLGNAIKRALTPQQPEGGLIHADRQRRARDWFYTMPVAVPTSVMEGGNTEQFLEAVTEFEFQFDLPYQTGTPWQMLGITSPLDEWDHQTRRSVLERSHLLWERDPLANAAVSYNRLFAVGKGHNIRYLHKDVEEVLEAFRNNPENAVKEQDKLLLDALQVDGELFIRFHEGTDSTNTLGEVVITPLKPHEIHWIRHEPGFIRRPVEYHHVYTQDDGSGQNNETADDDIPADQMLHVAVNRLAYEQRGRPELFRIIPWLRAYKEWLEDRARQNKWRNALLWDVTLSNATPAQVASKQAQYREPPNPGSVAIHNDKEAWQAISNNVGAGDAAEDGHQIKMNIAAGSRLPEYFLGDGENANLASATAQQLPALKSFEEWQDIMTEMWTAVYQRVIEAAGLPEMVMPQDADGENVPDAEEIPVTEAFEISYTPLSDDDPKTLVEALQIAVMMEWLSNATARSMLPWSIDVNVEQKQIEAEREEMLNRDSPSPMMPGQEPEDEQEPESQDDDDTDDA